MWKWQETSLDETSKQKLEKQEKKKKKKKKKKQNRKQKKAEVMGVVAMVVMAVMRHRWVVECQHQAECRLPKPIRRNTQVMRQ